MKTLWTALLACVLAVASLDADAARRLGGGQSIGRQSSNVTQREAARPAPDAPAASPAQRQAQPGTPAAQAPAAPQRRPWGAMLGGLAAGLGLAWLASSLGLGEGFGQVLMFLLLALVVMAVIGMVMRRRQQAAAPAAGNGFAWQGAGATGPMPSADAAPPPPQYNPAKIGNDASARPWERSSMAFDAGKYGQPAGGLRIGSGLEGAQNWGVPPGFDTDGFLAASKRNFVTLQDAWDRSDIASLRAMMTDEMLGEIRSQRAEREKQGGGQQGRTEVVLLEAQLLGIEELADHWMASVEFSGMIREDASAGPSPFREVWNMTKPRDGRGGWLVAGVQALQ